MVKIEFLSPDKTSTATSTVTIPSGCSRATAHNLVRLPKLVIQPFLRELTKWTSFWESFSAAFDHNTSLSDVENLVLFGLSWRVQRLLLLSTLPSRLLIIRKQCQCSRNALVKDRTSSHSTWNLDVR